MEWFEIAFFLIHVAIPCVIGFIAWKLGYRTGYINGRYERFKSTTSLKLSGLPENVLDHLGISKKHDR